MRTAQLPQVGDTLAGKYVIEQVLGEGGMGVVYRAVHCELLQRVAIKLLLPQAANHATAAERFRREARAAAAMRGPHVCRVLDVGTLQGDLPFIVMEYLEGRDMASELRERGSLPFMEAVDYLLQACEALAEAHGAGIVHRDLKPANLFLSSSADGSRQVKVLDFGVSKAVVNESDGALRLTNTSTMVGSPLYMSPEQLDSARNVDARTDIWALGAVLYELVSGKPPFEGSSIPQLVSAVLHAAPIPMSERGGYAPAGLELVVARALEKDREQRFSSIADLALALTPFASVASSQAAGRVARVLTATAASSNGLDISPLIATQLAETAGTALAIREPTGRQKLYATRNLNVSGDGTPLSWQRAADSSASEASQPHVSRNRGLIPSAIGAGLGLALVLGLFFWHRAGSEDSPLDALLPAGSSLTPEAERGATTAPADGIRRNALSNEDASGDARDQYPVIRSTQTPLSTPGRPLGAVPAHAAVTVSQSERPNAATPTSGAPALLNLEDTAQAAPEPTPSASAATPKPTKPKSASAPKRVSRAHAKPKAPTAAAEAGPNDIERAVAPAGLVSDFGGRR